MTRTSLRSYGPSEHEPAVSPTTRYTISETARKLSIHRNTVAAHIRSGELKATLSRHGTLIRGQDILRWWRSRR